MNCNSMRWCHCYWMFHYWHSLCTNNKTSFSTRGSEFPGYTRQSLSSQPIFTPQQFRARTDSTLHNNIDRHGEKFSLFFVFCRYFISYYLTSFQLRGSWNAFQCYSEQVVNIDEKRCFDMRHTFPSSALALLVKIYNLVFERRCQSLVQVHNNNCFALVHDTKQRWVHCCWQSSIKYKWRRIFIALTVLRLSVNKVNHLLMFYIRSQTKINSTR